MKIEQLDLPEAAIGFLSSEGYSELYPPQSDSVEAGLLEGRSVMVSAATASGKTLIATLAMIKHLSGQDGGKIVYLSPLRALASEKFAEFKKLEGVPLGPRRARVGVSTGDLGRGADRGLAGSDVLVMTNERMDSVIRSGAEWVDEVGLVICDEVHLIGDENRGPTLEMVLTQLRTLARRPQMVCLSATVTNAGQIADWLGCALVSSDWRPVPLSEGVCSQTRVTMNDGRKFNVPRSSSGLAVDLGLQSVVSDGGQSLIFAPTRGRSKSYATKAAPAVSQILKKAEADRLAGASRKILSENTHTDLVRTLAALVRKGVAFHHAGLSQSCRRVVEAEFRRGGIKLLSSTPTLAAGVNLPARRVVISSVNRYDARVGGSAPISVLEYKQLCGRAGRPQYDDLGEAVTVTHGRLSDVVERYIDGSPEPVVSQIGGERSLRTHVLSVIVTHPGTRRDGILEFFRQTLGGLQLGRAAVRSGVAASLRFLESQELVVKKGGRYAATEFGQKVSALYIDPLTATYFRDVIRRTVAAGGGGRRRRGTRGPGAGAGGRRTFGFLHLVSSCEEFFPKFGLRYDDYDMAYEWIYSNSHEMLLPVSVEDCSRSLLALDMWVEEFSDVHLSDTLGMESGDVHRLTEAADWLLYCLREVSRHAGAGEDILGELAVLRTRVAYGIKEELAGLVGVRGIGRVRARALYGRGVRDLDDLARIPASRLAGIDKIGPSLARSIKAELGKARRGADGLAAAAVATAAVAMAAVVS